MEREREREYLGRKRKTGSAMLVFFSLSFLYLLSFILFVLVLKRAKKISLIPVKVYFQNVNLTLNYHSSQNKKTVKN